MSSYYGSGGTYDRSREERRDEARDPRYQDRSYTYAGHDDRRAPYYDERTARDDPRYAASSTTTPGYDAYAAGGGYYAPSAPIDPRYAYPPSATPYPAVYDSRTYADPRSGQAGYSASSSSSAAAYGADRGSSSSYPASSTSRSGYSERDRAAYDSRSSYGSSSAGREADRDRERERERERDREQPRDREHREREREQPRDRDRSEREGDRDRDRDTRDRDREGRDRDREKTERDRHDRGADVKREPARSSAGTAAPRAPFVLQASSAPWEPLPPGAARPPPPPTAAPASASASGAGASGATQQAVSAISPYGPGGRRRARKEDHETVGLVARPQVPATYKPSGRPVEVVVNHFRFQMKTQKAYQYAVDVQPAHESRNFKRLLLDQHQMLIGKHYIFDGTILFISRNIGARKELKAADKDGKEYALTLTLTNELTPDSPNAPLQFFNLIFRKMLRLLKYKQIGRHYFDPTHPIAIPQHKVELWPGYFTSVNPDEGGIVLMCDVAHKVLRTDTVLDLLKEIFDDPYRNEQQKRELAMSQIVSQVVLTRYNNRTYRIDDIAWDKSPRTTFSKRTGEQMSYQQYYDVTYNKKLTNDQQPLLVHKQKRRGGQSDEIICLVPELCSMTGFTDAMRADFQVMRDISQHTRMMPTRRGEEVLRLAHQCNYHKEVQEELKTWNLSLEDRMTTVPGRLLPPEQVHYRHVRQSINAETADWSHMTKNNELVDPKSCDSWLLVFPSKNTDHARNLQQTLERASAPLGMTLARPTMVPLSDDRNQTYLDAIRSNLSSRVQCVVCILPNNKKDRYDAIKKLLALDQPVPSQCVVARSLSNQKTFGSVCNKIIQQINCKLGGQLWVLEIPLKNTMLVGVDVCHDAAARGQLKQSVVGFCSSVNPTFSKYFSRVTFQGAGQELVDGLKSCMTDALREYRAQNNGQLPDRVLVYRDGVGDGMLQPVVDHEVPQIRETFRAESGGAKDITLAYIVVKKRIHTRMFSKQEQSLANPRPGTLVDSAATNRNWYDFFLVSQHVRQGTVTPTHYHVVYDTTRLAPDHVQLLTYKLCHLYYNWPGTIRVPAPCQYAHKISFLVGQSLHKDPSSRLRNTMYFL